MQNGSGVIYGAPPPGRGWPYPGDVVLYGCPPIEPPPRPFEPTPPPPPSIVTPFISNVPWLEAQMAELQKALTASQREVEQLRAENARLKASLPQRRRRWGNAP